MDNTAKNSETVVSKLTMSKAHKVRFSISFFIFALLWMGGLGIVSAVLLPQHLKDLVGPTASTAIFGVLNAATAIASLLSNLVFGNLSDRTRSRLGRRTPWVIGGGLVGGIS